MDNCLSWSQDGEKVTKKCPQVYELEEKLQAKDDLIEALLEFLKEHDSLGDWIDWHNCNKKQRDCATDG